MICPQFHAPQNSLQPEPAEKPVFRSIRDQKMKGSLKLAACLDSLATEHLASEFTQMRGHSVVLDAGQVTFLGALALQLLLASYRQWQDDGKSFQIINPSAAFLDGISLFGVAASSLRIEETAEVLQ